MISNTADAVRSPLMVNRGKRATNLSCRPAKKGEAAASKSGAITAAQTANSPQNRIRANAQGTASASTNEPQGRRRYNPAKAPAAARKTRNQKLDQCASVQRSASPM